MDASTRSTQSLTIALGTAIRSGAFGGGNQFARALQSYLLARGHRVIQTLDDSTIDIIVVTEPRFWSASSAFDIVAALRYQKKFPQTRILHRINECDQRKGRPAGLHNTLLKLTAQQADGVVFVSEWLQQLHQGDDQEAWPPSSVIHNGADRDHFNPTNQAIWNHVEPLKLVTHHWSDNWHKGWDVYQAVDDLIEKVGPSKLQFTVVGNVWPGVNLKHTTVVAPLTDSALAEELKKHHVYITASRAEPGPMHIVEALQCGLPIIYGTSGSLSEYATAHGLPIKDPADLLQVIERMRGQYDAFMQQNYFWNSSQMSAQYEQLFLTVSRGKQTASWRVLVHLRILQALLWVRQTLS